MRETKERNEETGELSVCSALLAVAKQLSSHCDKVEVMLKGFEVKQINDEQFSLKQPFISKKSSLTKAALTNIVEDHEAMRRNVREITEIGFVDFEILFPKLGINFETFYSVAISLLNLIYQMQLMRLNCFRLLKS